jgi:tRNA (mo5U34)-methyltransferase
MGTLLEHQVSAPTEERAREIAALGPWFHNLHLPDGSQTAPYHRLGDFPAVSWRALTSHIPEDLTGWTALDLGCNAGFYSFQLAARGARVTGIDVEPLFLAQARWAAREFGHGDEVQFREGQVYDLARDETQYDLILFLGVFYHLRYPMLALDLVARRVRRLLAFQTLTMPGMEVAPQATEDHDIDARDVFLTPGWPTMAFIEHAFAGDATNWWAPTHAAVLAMLRSAGMRLRAHAGTELYVCEPSGSATWMTERGARELAAASGTR